MPEFKPEQPKLKQLSGDFLKPNGYPFDLKKLSESGKNPPENQRNLGDSKASAELKAQDRKHREIPLTVYTDKKLFYLSKSGREFPATDAGYADMKADNGDFWERQKKPKKLIE